MRNHACFWWRSRPTEFRDRHKQVANSFAKKRPSDLQTFSGGHQHGSFRAPGIEWGSPLTWCHGDGSVLCETGKEGQNDDRKTQPPTGQWLLSLYKCIIFITRPHHLTLFDTILIWCYLWNVTIIIIKQAPSITGELLLPLEVTGPLPTSGEI